MTASEGADSAALAQSSSVAGPHVVLLHAGGEVPAWAIIAAASAVTLARGAMPGGDSDRALARTLGEVDCVLLDADAGDPLAAARVAHRIDPEVQVVVVAATEARRRALQRTVTFTSGVGELWLASPDEVAGGITERAAGVTRQRRKFRRTRERIERERVEESPQRSMRALISDAYLADLLEVLPDPVFSVDGAGRILSTNPAACMLRSGSTGLVGAPIDEVLGTSEVPVTGMLAAAGEGGPSRAAVSFRRSDGTAGHGELLVARVAASEPPLYAVLLHDLTERHEAQRRLEAQTTELERANQLLQEQASEVEMQAEELGVTVNELEARSAEAERAHEALAESERQFRTLADAIPTLAWTARVDGYLDWYNARWYEYTGTTPEQMEGWGWQRVHDPAMLPAVMELWQRSIATGAPFEMTFPLRGADGTYRQFLTRVTPVRSADGDVARWFGTNTDVEAERAARAAAEEANRAKSQFLSTMSHELRTPLNAIQGYAELLSIGVRGPVTPEQVHDLDRIRRANQHLMSLITDVLNFAQLEAGKVEFHLAAVEVAPLIADVESMVAPQLGAKGLTFDCGGCAPRAADRPHVVRADAEKLRQVLLNLLTNAIKFTEPGGHVALTCETEAAAGVVRMVVSDTGRGIAAEQRERIFEPFVQVDRHRTQESQQGVGLGLAISRDLVREMGGDITLSSEVGAGSKFTITLPRG